MQSAFTVPGLCETRRECALQTHKRGTSQQRGGYILFSPGEHIAKSRLTAIGGIWMNDSALGGFVDC